MSKNMLASLWGPSFWNVLHILSFSYPDEPTNDDKKNYYTFYYNLQYILPCEHCRDNLKKNYKILPLTAEVFKNSDSLSKYIYKLHELINKELNKKTTLTYEDIKNKYEQYIIKKSTRFRKCSCSELHNNNNDNFDYESKNIKKSKQSKKIKKSKKK
jgi:hypothetical protein